ncbi:SDR family NAD(P)-dependent oxidoreductase [Actinorugispora endophytica]|uniref:NADP-dependent 3-hydroxy acid dehydrogenase YdfG n=1 Tax=Actinorugispora endophytica TaxID=1605990 RepID=A0A4R6UI77_9ACTN|nr:SDR family NAD(P)-dependent oxidoreductase [Actinorugispora endophytica]TDQ46142.1 NADP-dependent 3-hydroxy acid dehydrogenase YdfG [Actinorugispora endophytica]
MTTAAARSTARPDASGRVWFVTGASRGLGRVFAEAALDRGDRVVGVARDVTPLDDLVAAHDGRLVAFPLDVADRAAVMAGVERAVAAFGRLDVVVNNAGGFLYGMLEEATEEQVRAHLDVNLLGALWVFQAVVPHLREQGSGHILQVTSMGSTGGFATVGLYGAGKAALDSISEAMAMEVADFGVKVTIVQPGGYETGLFTQGTTATAENEAYAPLRARMAEMWSEGVDAAPEKAAPAVMEVVDMAEPPRRLILGGLAYDQAVQLLRARLDEHARWEALSRTAD